MPSKPQPFRLPQRFDSPTLAKLAISGEPTVIVRAVGVGSTAPFEYSDRNGRQAIFRYDQKYDAHVLKVPASIWNANKGFMAHELMDQRRLPHPLVVTVEVPTTEDSPPNGAPLKDWIQALGMLTSLAPDMVINVHDPIGMAQTIHDTVSKSQDGQVVKSSGPYPEDEGSNPSPATNSPEMDAPGKSEEASDVVVGQVSEQPGASASETLSSPSPGWEMTTSWGNMIRQKAWNLLESHMRLKALTALLAADDELQEVAAKDEFEEAVKTALQDPLSAVELGHAGWMKRREPQA